MYRILSKTMSKQNKMCHIFLVLLDFNENKMKYIKSLLQVPFLVLMTQT